MADATRAFDPDEVFNGYTHNGEMATFEVGLAPKWDMETRDLHGEVIWQYLMVATKEVELGDEEGAEIGHPTSEARRYAFQQAGAYMLAKVKKDPTINFFQDANDDHSHKIKLPKAVWAVLDSGNNELVG